MSVRIVVEESVVEERGRRRGYSVSDFNVITGEVSSKRSEQ